MQRGGEQGRGRAVRDSVLFLRRVLCAVGLGLPRVILRTNGISDPLPPPPFAAPVIPVLSARDDPARRHSRLRRRRRILSRMRMQMVRRGRAGR